MSNYDKYITEARENRDIKEIDSNKELKSIISKMEKLKETVKAKKSEFDKKDPQMYENYISAIDRFIANKHLSNIQKEVIMTLSQSKTFTKNEKTYIENYINAKKEEMEFFKKGFEALSKIPPRKK